MARCFRMRTSHWLTSLALCFFAVQLAAQPPEFGNRGNGPQPSGATFQRLEPEDLTEELGRADVPDRATFEKLSYQGNMRMDAYLSDIECVKFIIEAALTDKAKVYWMNTNTFQAHPQFMGRIGMQGGRMGMQGSAGGGRGGFGGGGFGDPGSGPSSGGRMMRGAVSYMPRLKCPDGSVGLYIFDFQPNDQFRFEEIKFANDMLLKTAPFLKGKLAFHPLQGNVSQYESDKEQYAQSDVAVYRDEDLYKDIGFLPLNLASSFGRLRALDNDVQAAPRDIVICKSLPNQMPRVAGVISAVRQTPLSHVNLRAIQDKVPNAYIADALESPAIQSLIGRYVHYSVNSQGYSLREATLEEVDQFFASIRPEAAAALLRDFTKTEVLPLKEIAFTDSKAFGVKAANMAAMQTFGFAEGVVPDGVAVPFFFYDEFMKHNGLYDKIAEQLNSDEFKSNRHAQEKSLTEIRKAIESASMPDWMMDKLAAAQASFAPETSLRCRSSTNNEDLPGFSGAGLYDSYTHKPSEGHLSSTIKQVYASLWNYRAFEEREFYRVDHFETAMGVLIHPNFKDEKANGVAVTDDILYDTKGNYYVNVQIGEDLVTNPDAESSPEEILIGWYKQDGDQRVRLAADGKPILSDPHIDELRGCMARVHGRFAKLYGKTQQDRFAMEIEFKITKDDRLVIKQARPWVY